jgi:hypothetical protein
LANLWKNLTSVIEAQNNLLKRVDTAMGKQFKTFNQHFVFCGELLRERT